MLIALSTVLTCDGDYGMVILSHPSSRYGRSKRLTKNSDYFWLTTSTVFSYEDFDSTRILAQHSNKIFSFSVPLFVFVFIAQSIKITSIDNQTSNFRHLLCSPSRQRKWKEPRIRNSSSRNSDRWSEKKVVRVIQHLNQYSFFLILIARYEFVCEGKRHVYINYDSWPKWLPLTERIYSRLCVINDNIHAQIEAWFFGVIIISLLFNERSSQAIIKSNHPINALLRNSQKIVLANFDQYGSITYLFSLIETWNLCQCLQNSLTTIMEATPHWRFWWN